MLPLTYRQALANRRFRLFTLGFGISSLGDGMSALAVAWLAIEISSPGNRGLVVGGAVAAYTLPGAIGLSLRRILGPLDSGRLLLLNCGLRGVCLGTIALLAFLGRLKIASYVVLLAGSALLASWGTAARYALVAETLPEGMRLGGNALLGALLNFGFIAGPAVAGLLTAVTGPAAVLALDGLSWFVYAGCVILAHAPSSSGVAEPIAASTANTQSALRMIRGDRTLFGLLILTLAFYFFYGPVEVALPIFVKQDLHQSAAVLGAYWTCFGIGATTGGLAFGILRRAPLFTTALLIIVGWGGNARRHPFCRRPLRHRGVHTGRTHLGALPHTGYDLPPAAGEWPCSDHALGSLDGCHHARHAARHRGRWPACRWGRSSPHPLHFRPRDAGDRPRRGHHPSTLIMTAAAYHGFGFHGHPGPCEAA